MDSRNYEVDLTLKLGLPYEDNNQSHLGQHLDHHNPTPSHLTNFNFSGPYTHHQGAFSSYGILREGGQINMNMRVNEGQPNINAYGMVTQRGNAGNNPIGGQNSNEMGWGEPNSYGSVVGIPISNPTYFNAPSGGSSSSIISRRKDSTRPTYNDPNKRCSNFNCNSNDTPMWRKGPLGPKTLCNACGIKYRKEAEKKRAKEGASTSK